MVAKNARQRRGEPVESFAETFSELRSSYDAANRNGKYRRARTGINWNGSNADSHYKMADLLTMIEGSRDLAANHPVVGQGFARVVDSVHKKLYELEPQTGDSGVNRALKDHWTAWATDPDMCDIQGRRAFSEIARQCLLHTFVDGDPLALLLSHADSEIDGRLETLESHRLRGPSSARANLNVTAPLGIELNPYGRPIKYYITRSDFGTGYAGVTVSDLISVAARDENGHRNVLHLYDQRRFSQNRGIPILAAVFDMCGFLDDVEFAQLVKAQLAACFAVIEELPAEKESNTKYAPPDALGVIGPRDTQTEADGSSRTTEGLFPGMRYQTKPGGKMQLSSPNVPNDSFFNHVEHILTLIAINMGLPVQALLLEPKANFSAWRGAESKAREGWKAWQAWLIDSLYVHVYRWKVRQWMIDDPALNRAANRQRSKPDIFKHKWRPHGWPYIQPEVEVKANSLRVACGQAAPSDIHAESDSSGTWSDHNVTVMRERGEQIAAALANVATIKEKFPDADVTWRDFPIITAAGQSVSQAFSDSTSESTTDTEPTDTSTKRTAGAKA